MKTLIICAILALGLAGCATQKQEAQPQNIDKHNVGITKGESLDQTDPTLIEGNLEDNDFKN